jgi:hypothetical protein
MSLLALGDELPLSRPDRVVGDAAKTHDVFVLDDCPAAPAEDWL